PGNVGDTFSRTKTVRDGLSAINRSNVWLSHNDRVVGNQSSHPDYNMMVSRSNEGWIYGTHAVNYIFNLGDDVYEFQFRSSRISDNERVRWRRVGASNWNNVSATFSSSGNTTTATFSPIEINGEDDN